MCISYAAIANEVVPTCVRAAQDARKGGLQHRTHHGLRRRLAERRLAPDNLVELDELRARELEGVDLFQEHAQDLAQAEVRESVEVAHHALGRGEGLLRAVAEEGAGAVARRYLALHEHLRPARDDACHAAHIVLVRERGEGDEVAEDDDFLVVGQGEVEAEEALDVGGLHRPVVQPLEVVGHVDGGALAVSLDGRGEDAVGAEEGLGDLHPVGAKDDRDRRVFLLQFRLIRGEELIQAFFVQIRESGHEYGLCGHGG
mmetsp:Transcript_13642/g.26730  ORF Transcript_13642/g.26730 Transcript_13642/m.26730 type:complete len:258 (-) Transcript_13642:73-846(-)